MKQITKQTAVCFPENTTSPSIRAHYFESEELFIIVNGRRESIEFPQRDIPKLIAMLQSLGSGIK